MGMRICIMHFASSLLRFFLVFIFQSTFLYKSNEICLEKDRVESNIKPRFLADRLDIMGLVVGREREGLTILQVC